MTQEQSDNVEAEDFGREGTLLTAFWSNIQHNENTRNRFFQFYLIIAGGYSVIIEKDFLKDSPVIALSVFIWAVGVTFLWAYERLREMLARDVKITRIILESLRSGTQVERDALAAYEKYYSTVATTSTDWWSITTAIAFATNGIGAFVLAVGLAQALDLVWWQAGIIWLVSVAVTMFAVKKISRFAFSRTDDSALNVPVE